MEKTSKTIKSSEILDKKIFHEIESGGNITEFIISYVNDKTYKSFRTFSKKLKEIVKLLFEDGIIDEKDLKKIEECISIKTKFRKPEIIFNLPSFLEEYTEMFEFSKKNKNNLTNWFFLLIPFLIAKGLKEIKNIKYKEIKFHKLPNCLILEYSPSGEDNLDNDLKEEPMCIKINSYYKEYEDMYNLLKEGRTVVINLEGVELTVAQRSIDFVGGATYAINGSLQAVSNNIFIAAPDSIEVSGDLKSEIMNENTISPQLK